jgi:hypothetical protein
MFPQGIDVDGACMLDVYTLTLDGFTIASKPYFNQHLREIELVNCSFADATCFDFFVTWIRFNTTSIERLHLEKVRTCYARFGLLEFLNINTTLESLEIVNMHDLVFKDDVIDSSELSANLKRLVLNEVPALLTEQMDEILKMDLSYLSMNFKQVPFGISPLAYLVRCESITITTIPNVSISRKVPSGTYTYTHDLIRAAFQNKNIHSLIYDHSFYGDLLNTQTHITIHQEFTKRASADRYQQQIGHVIERNRIQQRISSLRNLVTHYLYRSFSMTN